MSDSFATEDRLRRELRNASRLKNPHIVEFRGAAWDHEAGPGSPRNVLLVTELMAGGNLRESLNLLSDGVGLAVDSFVHIALHIARGIEYLHAEGLAHRDIKSANILLTEPLAPYSTRFPNTVRAKIADFGLSKYIDKATGGGTVMQSILEPGRLEATYSYLAPESFGGDKSNVIRRTESDDEEDGRYDEMAKKRDIYALGVLFWEILTGQIPWYGVALPDVYVRVCVRSDRPGPALDDSKVSKSVRRLVERCWAQNPLKRPSAKSIVAKLEKLAVRYGTADQNSAAAAAAVEAASMVSGQVSRDLPTATVPNGNPMPDLQSEPLRDLTDQRDISQQQTPSESVMSYQKMPSASTVYTTHNEGSKTHSTGFEVPDARDMDRIEDVPGQFDDTVWIDDADVHSKVQGQRATAGVHVPPPHPSATASQAASQSGSAENDPSSLNRRLVRPRHHVPDVAEASHNRSHSGPSSNNQNPQPVASAAPPAAANPSPSPHGKSNATAVAATAAAIAAAKDRERKRDDVRSGRGPSTRVTRPGTALGAGEVSFQSLPGSVEGWQRNAAKEQRALYYDNSDEEAQDFDPERAAAEEAIAESTSFSTQQHNSRSANGIPRVPPPAQRSTSQGRVGVRPKSPVVRRPMSPMAGRPFSPVVSQGRVVNEDDCMVRGGPSSLPRISDAAVHKKSSSSRGLLGRTMSASTPNAANVRQGPTPVPPVSATSKPSSESAGRRAFIRRMRSNETSRRIARSSSSTGVENRKSKGALTKNSPSHVSDTVISEEEDVEYTTIQIGCGPKEDFQATVEALEKVELMRLLSQRMAPLRLAGLAHASLISPKHRCEEELLRNSCAILHRLTVPGNSSQSKNNNQEISLKEQNSIKKYLKSSHGVEALLQALHPPHVRHPTTLSYGLLALGNLTASDGEARKMFRSAHGVLLVTKVMKTHIQNSGVQEKGCYALACVGAAYPAKLKNVFEQAGSLDVVIGALSDAQRDSPSDAVTKQACAALGAMCSSSPGNALYAGKKEALTFLVTAFERFRRASRVDGGKRSEMRLVCKAFIDLLCHSENRKLAGSKGGSTMIIRAMRIFRLDADFIEKGLTTLAEFCTYRSNGAQIVQANGVDDIVAAMERFRLSVEMQREGSRVLTLLMKATGDQARRRLVHAGGAEAIVFALERFGAIPDSNVALVVETCRALHMLFMMENTAEGDILGRRMKKIKCDKAIKTAMVTHKGTTTVQERGREAVKALGHLKSGGGLWGRMRNGQKKR